VERRDQLRARQRAGEVVHGGARPRRALHQIDKGTGARIRNRKVSAETGKALDADDIEMGFEIEDGRYVTFDKGELDELRPASTRSIDVTDFVDLCCARPWRSGARSPSGPS
jgi:Ku70/Ku80 beta-barrel domain